MFSSIHIRDFRSCHDVRLTDLNEILVLIGRNGAGKTNILKAIQWVSLFVDDASEKPTPGNRRLSSQEGDVSLTFGVDGSSYTYELKKATHVDVETEQHILRTNVEERIFMHLDSGRHLLVHRKGETVNLSPIGDGEALSFEMASTTSSLFAIQALFPEKSPYRIHVVNILRFLSGVRYYPLHNFEETTDEVIVSGSAYQKWKSGKTENLNSLTSLLYTLIQMSEEKNNTFVELNSLIGPNGMNLIDKIEVVAHTLSRASVDLLPETDKNSLYFVTFRFPGHEKRHFSINDLSFGTVRILFLLVSMLNDEASVSLIEQPEDGIHIALVDKLIPLLRSYSKNSQFIVASHSSSVMNRAGAEEIRFVANHSGYTSARSLSPEELQAAKVYLEEDGPLSEFLESIEES